MVGMGQAEGRDARADRLGQGRRERARWEAVSSRIAVSGAASLRPRSLPRLPGRDVPTRGLARRAPISRRHDAVEEASRSGPATTTNRPPRAVIGSSNLPGAVDLQPLRINQEDRRLKVVEHRHRPRLALRARPGRSGVMVQVVNGMGLIRDPDEAHGRMRRGLVRPVRRGRRPRVPMVVGVEHQIAARIDRRERRAGLPRPGMPGRAAGRPRRAALARRRKPSGRAGRALPGRMPGRGGRDLIGRSPRSVIDAIASRTARTALALSRMGRCVLGLRSRRARSTGRCEHAALVHPMGAVLAGGLFRLEVRIPRGRILSVRRLSLRVPGMGPR